MKKLFTFAIIVMAAMAILFAMDSCKKDAQNAPSNIPPQSAQAFDPTLIEDMNAYLADFKKKMQESKGGESLSLEEAAWHLSSVANYDFANASVPFDDIRFDTLYNTMPVANGTVLLCDLALAYERISTDIDRFYQSLPFDEKHFRFINTSISNEGTIMILLITTFQRNSKYWGDTLWCYPDLWSLSVDCYSLFPETSYPACTSGASALELALNLKESHTITVGEPLTKIYYTATFDSTFYYRNEIDPFGSSCYMNSRLYANITYFDADILPIICYLYDSYLGLGYSNCPLGQCVVYWRVDCDHEPPLQGTSEHHWKEHHLLTVGYGEKHELPQGSGGGNL